jgi:ankyrin repeat protein
MQRNVNPFWRNHSNHTAMSIAQTNNDKEIISLLNDYACFRPTRIHARWFGPFFLMRAYTFLLVLKRVGKIPKDVSNLILFFLGKLEYI